MKQPTNSQDPLDALLASQPVQASSDFTERTLAKMRRPKGLDSLIDEQLADFPVDASPNYAERVVAACTEKQDEKIIGFPSWVIAIGSIAALLVAGIVAFAAMFQKGWQDASQRQATALESSPSIVATAEVSVPEQASAADLAEWEDILLMQEALIEVAALSDQQEWQTLAFLAN